MTQTERDATTKCETDKQTQLATKMAECMVICTVPENPDLSCGSQFIVSDNKACEAECEWKQYGPLAHIANMPTTYECESSASVIFECNCVGTAEPETF
ncbi:hypothetical protein KC571_04430 [candidate division WWE3 bacterium]|uniref:Uncharacterized protein n=1 Tax=candidate division WWE3 bacterium TaxID=2053526 RepID=A0A955LI23_UNCKA|nr:hypothetical protein [candidate division WWE3 bacterium]